MRSIILRRNIDLRPALVPSFDAEVNNHTFLRLNRGADHADFRDTFLVWCICNTNEHSPMADIVWVLSCVALALILIQPNTLLGGLYPAIPLRTVL